MKNKFFNTLIIFLMVGYAYGQEFTFQTKKLKLMKNFVKAYQGKAISKDGELEIIGEIFDYDKEKNILEINNSGSIIIKTQKLEIFFDKSIVNQTNKTIESKGNVRILDRNNNLEIKSSYLFYDKNLSQIKSDAKTIIQE